MLRSLLLLSTLFFTIANAYVLRGWTKKNREGRLVLSVDNSINSGTYCHNVDRGYENTISSFVFTATPLCTAKFMSQRDCHGDRLGRSTGGWWKDELSAEADNKIDSVEVTCII
ncbi:uncharacterized protein VTP21DRAFT_9758 [Calcarisporiella thermophila]|uniref:uncharacterized protein n=1 Tax=Calcarisporiella thermophila TaxID=911321 RepID=UPI0037428A62